MNNPLYLIIRREYLERVKRKSFIITTIVMPIIMIAIMAAPALFLALGKTEKKTVTVIDYTSQIASRLQSNEEIEFVSSDAPADTLRADEDVEAILVIGNNAIDNPKTGITLMSRGTVPMMTNAYITGQLTNAIEEVRLDRYNIEGLKQIIEEAKPDVSLTTVRMDLDTDQETSSEFSYFLSLALDMILYMFILIYGQMVMTSIIEEKGNRVLEIVVSSVKPFYLMLGKITGIGLVAVTQILIWGVLLSVAGSLLLPMLTPDNLGADTASEFSGVLSQVTDPGFMLSLFAFVLIFFIGGFLFYSSIYAAIGSAVSNIQDASQLSSIATMPIIIAVIGSMAVINDPESSLAFWLSIVPFTSPMVMMARLPFGVALWETFLALGVLFASLIFMIWLCGKIYRIGIFMYGKKPTLMEIIKWARYK
ncbi:MAG: ABC transporter permease [Muribaculaceae bacterium]|nr:ABC transporter permease [Muribaculaceae bacterium]